MELVPTNFQIGAMMNGSLATAFESFARKCLSNLAAYRASAATQPTARLLQMAAVITQCLRLNGVSQFGLDQFGAVGDG